MEEHYFVAWGIYLGSGMMFFVLWWQLNSFIGIKIFRDFSRGLMFLLIFFPWQISVPEKHYVPASLIVALEFSIGSADEIGGALTALLFSIGCLCFVLILRAIFNR